MRGKGESGREKMRKVAENERNLSVSKIDPRLFQKFIRLRS